MKIDTKTIHYRDLNHQIRQAVAMRERSFELANVNGQRYIGDGLKGEIEIVIRGVAGNDLGAFMDGPIIRVQGNAQDGVGNTMNAGRIIVHGSAGDVLGYAMRGGEVLVRDNVGYRVGIHMKAFRDHFPVIVAGGMAGDFLGEYMAGGMIIILGLDRDPSESLVGDWCATGMHGGVIYLRGEPDPTAIASRFVTVRQADESDREQMRPYLEHFSQAFGLDATALDSDDFVRIAPLSHRPFAAKYAA